MGVRGLAPPPSPTVTCFGVSGSRLQGLGQFVERPGAFLSWFQGAGSHCSRVPQRCVARSTAPG